VVATAAQHRERIPWRLNIANSLFLLTSYSVQQ
jgi:hypothetical protein